MNAIFAGGAFIAVLGLIGDTSILAIGVCVMIVALCLDIDEGMR